jgi:hypothetical protein
MTDIICRLQTKQAEYTIEISGDNKVRHYAIDHSECSEPYAIIMCLTEFITETTDINSPLPQPLHIYVNDLRAYNILTSYLGKWKANNWIMSQGKPCAYIDILEGFFDICREKGYSYTGHLMKC